MFLYTKVSPRSRDGPIAHIGTGDVGALTLLVLALTDGVSLIGDLSPGRTPLSELCLPLAPTTYSVYLLSISIFPCGRTNARISKVIKRMNIMLWCIHYL